MKNLDSFILLYHTLLNDIHRLIKNCKYTEKDIKSITKILDHIFNMVTKTLNIKNVYEKICILKTLHEINCYFTSGKELDTNTLNNIYSNLVKQLNNCLKDTHYAVYIKYGTCYSVCFSNSYIEEVIIVNNETHTFI
jgi:hypothetical protein